MDLGSLFDDVYGLFNDAGSFFEGVGKQASDLLPSSETLGGAKGLLGSFVKAAGSTYDKKNSMNTLSNYNSLNSSGNMDVIRRDYNAGRSKPVPSVDPNEMITFWMNRLNTFVNTKKSTGVSVSD